MLKITGRAKLRTATRPVVRLSLPQRDDISGGLRVSGFCRAIAIRRAPPPTAHTAIALGGGAGTDRAVVATGDRPDGRSGTFQANCRCACRMRRSINRTSCRSSERTSMRSRVLRDRPDSSTRSVNARNASAGRVDGRVTLGVPVHCRIK